jgi:hypothetical protein
MTSSVTVTAHCAKSKQVSVIITKGDFVTENHLIQDGESRDYVVYDDRRIAIYEMDK